MICGGIYLRNPFWQGSVTTQVLTVGPHPSRHGSRVPRKLAPSGVTWYSTRGGISG